MIAISPGKEPMKGKQCECWSRTMPHTEYRTGQVNITHPSVKTVKHKGVLVAITDEGCEEGNTVVGVVYLPEKREFILWSLDYLTITETEQAQPKE